MTSPIPPNVRNNLLAGGSNVSFPFYEDIDLARIQRYEGYLPDMKAKGIHAVRIGMSMNNFEDGKTGNLRTDRWERLIQYVKAAIALGITPIIDNHNTGLRGDDGVGDWTNDYMGDLRNSGVRTRHISLMKAMAKKIQDDPALVDEVVFTYANEPIFSNDPQIWYNHQKALVPAIRAVAPDVIMTYLAHDWNGDRAFVSNWDAQMKPFAMPGGVFDPRLIGDVHWYSPVAFSHDTSGQVSYPGQIADWRTNNQPSLWDKARMRTLLKPLADFVAAKGLPLVLISEYGAGRAVEKESRLRYVTDVSDLWREFGFGHTIYTYAENDSFKINGVDDRIWAAVTRPLTTEPPDEEPPDEEPPDEEPPPVEDDALSEQERAAVAAMITAALAAFKASLKVEGTFTVK